MVLFRLVFGDAAVAEGLALAEPWRGMVVRLIGVDLGGRQALLDAMTAELPGGRAVLDRALRGVAGAVPGGPGSQTPATIRAASVAGLCEAGSMAATEAAGFAAEPTILEFKGVDPWPSPIGEAAMRGLAGDLVRAIEPTTEADPAAILIQFLVGFGSLIGKGAHVLVDGHRHHANLFAVIVGDTSRARKGTSWRRVREALEACDPAWTADRLMGGLSSGEGLIWAVRDPIMGIDKRHGGPTVVDHGISDKRLLVIENEFGGALRVLGREGSTLSAILRQAYDGDDLRFLTKNNPAAATAPHVSLCGHVTREELEKHLSSVEAFNGLGNRILWTCARRSKGLPFGGEADAVVMSSLGAFLAVVAAEAREAGRLAWAESGAARWDASYDDLTTSQPGLLGAVTSRAEAHALRLAMVYALLDRRREITADDVDAALAVWRYCADSAALLFARSSGDSRADRVLAVLARNPEGLTRTEIHRDAFTRETSASTVARVLEGLVRAGSVSQQTTSTGGRPAERFFVA